MNGDLRSVPAPPQFAQSIRVLCIDIEGAHGGSSRSLYQSVANMDRSRAMIEVVCRKGGIVEDRYAGIEIPCRVAPEMPKISSLPRFSRNVLAYAGFARAFPRSAQFRRALAAEINERFDLVHFNHEGLFLLARWLRSRTNAAFTMHVRTNLVDTPFARWQTRMISGVADHLVFITENEEARFRALGGNAPGTVIYNIVPGADSTMVADPRIPADGRLKIAAISNYSWQRGTDRLIDVAEELVHMGRRDVMFVVAGDVGISGSLPGQLGRIARRGGTLADYAKARDVADMFLFLGHTQAPEQVLAGCDLLAKLTRGNDPWGRDIIEAMAQGRSVLSVGTWNRFVETDLTGVLQDRFEARAMALIIAELADNRQKCRSLGDAAARRVARLCYGPDRAAELLAVWQQVCESRGRDPHNACSGDVTDRSCLTNQ